MDDIKDPTGNDPTLGGDAPAPAKKPLREVRPESETRGGSDSVPQDEEEKLIDEP